MTFQPFVPTGALVNDVMPACGMWKRAASTCAVAVVLFAMSGAAVSAQAGEPVTVRTLVVRSDVFGNTRTVRVYLPPGYGAPERSARRYPVLYMNDGFAVFSERSWDGPNTVDRAIRAGDIPPLILVGIDSAASIAGAANPGLDRANEYLPYDDKDAPEGLTPRGRDYPRFLFEEVMPLVEASFRVDPERVSLGGSSFGAIAALHAASRSPRPIAALLLESPPLFMFDDRLTREVAGRWPPIIYLGIGTKETEDPQILARGERAIERFVAAARAALVQVVFNRVDGATHTSAAWRARLAAALAALY